MDNFVPKVVIKKPPLISLIAESKIDFEIENFLDYEHKEKISAEFLMPKVNLTCSVIFIPFNDENYSYLNMSISGFDETIWKSKKYQLEVIASADTNILTSSGLQNIDEEWIEDVFGKSWIDRSELQEKLKGGSLVLVISAKIFIKNSLNNINKLAKLNFNNSEIIKMNSKILETKLFSDFKFIVQGVEFKVHRNILAASSSVFAKMFSSGLAESQSGKCQLNGIKPEIFKLLLEFIYAGKVPDNVSDVAKDLFEAAHYYGIENLTEICKEELPASLNVENAMETYKWAWTYEIEELKVEAWKIIKRDIIKDSVLGDIELPSIENINRILDLKEKTEALYMELKGLKTSK